jgi:hypothetical protein
MPLFNLRAQVGFLIIKFPADHFRLSELKSPIFIKNTYIRALSPFPLTEVRSQKSEVRGQKTDNRKQMTDDGEPAVCPAP